MALLIKSRLHLHPRFQQYLFAAQSHESVRANSEYYMEEWCNQLGMSFKRSDRQWIIGGVAKVYIRGGTKITDHSFLRGRQIHSGFLDECTKLHSSFIETARRRFSQGDSMLLMATNSAEPSNYIFEAFIETPRPRQFTMGEDDWSWDSNFYFDQEMRADLEADAPWTVGYARDIRGEWAAEEGAVFPDLKQFFVPMEDGETMRQNARGIVAVDAGVGSTTFGLLAVPKGNGNWRIVDEYVWRMGRKGRLDDEEHLKNMRAKWTFQEIVIDDSAANFREVALKYGLVPHFGRSNYHTKLDGIRVLCNVLYRGRLDISERCVILRGMMAGYQYDETNDRLGHANSHGPDTARYLADYLFPGWM